MLRIIAIDLKRLFSNKLSLALAVIAPVISLLLLASLIAPLFFSNKRLSQVTVAVFQEEQHPDAQYVVDNVVNDPQIQSLIDIRFVDSLNEGIALTQNGEAALFIYIPAGIIDKLYYREQATIETWVSPDYAFEAAIILPIVNSIVDGFNRIQLGLDLVYFRAVDDFSQEEAGQHYYDLSILLGLRVLNRTALFDIEGLSPLGRFLPVEYYTSAIFAFFTGLGLIPLAGYNARDFTDAALIRGLAVTRWRYKYLFARVLSGALYILLVILPMLIVGILVGGMDILFSGSILALVGMAVLSSLCFSCLAVFFGLVLPKNDNAIWLGFYFILMMALVGGVIFPNDFIPQSLLTIGRFSPLRASMNSFAIAMFDYQFSNLQFSVLILFGWLILAWLVSIPLFNRRIHA